MNWFERYDGDPALDDFVPVSAAGARILVRRSYEANISEMGLLGGSRRVVDRAGGGRGAHPIVQLAAGERVLIREYRRGGALRHLNQATYFVPNRALDELRVTVVAHKRGVSVPHVVAAVERRAGIGYRATFVTRWIDGARDLAAWVTAAGPESSSTVMRAAGAEVARMHRAGIAHPDLNLRNLLVEARATANSPGITIIDFDRAILGESPISARRRARDLRRLARSARKLATPIGAAGWEAFRVGYGSDWPLTGDLG